MLVAAAVCPHPPALLPEVAAGAAPELAQVRAACGTAVRSLLASSPDLVAVVGGAEVAAPYAEQACGSLAGFGVALSVGGPGPQRLPLSLTIGRWLLTGAGWTGPLALESVAWHDDPDLCAATGRRLGALAGRVGLLVMADGSARRSPQAPGYVDPRAPDYDDRIAAALRSGEPEKLAALDPGAAAELMVAGRAALQALGGAAGGAAWRADLLALAAPYGVGYFVAQWLPIGNLGRQD